MKRLNVKILGYYDKGNFGDELLYLSLVEILKNLNINYSKSIQEGMPLRFKYFNTLFESDHQISIGGLLQSITSLRSFYYYIGMMNLARSNIIFGGSFGPFRHEKHCLKLMKNIKGLNGILLRDWNSYKIASELWINDDVDIEYGTDIVFNLDLSRYIEKWEHRNYVLIIIKRNEDRRRLYEFIRNVKKYLNIEILVSIFDKKDLQELRKIKHDFYDDPMVKTKNPEILKDAINLVYNARYVFSYRLHPIVLAILFEKPFSNISSNEKIINFLNPYLDHSYCKDFQEAFEYLNGKESVRKMRRKHFSLAEKNINFLKRNLHNNIFMK